MKVAEFYRFMNERESIRLDREEGRPFPWTEDPILRAYKFTNVRREHDRTTRILNDTFYSKDHHGVSRRYVQERILLNCATFRYFGTHEFACALGWMDRFDPEYIRKLANERMAMGARVFTGAYVVTNQGIKAPKVDVVVDHFLTGIWENRREICQVADFNSWSAMVEAFARVKGFGGTGFMAKEVTLDMMLCRFWHAPDGRPIDYKSWTPVGPGARRGLQRVFGPQTGKTDWERLAQINFLVGQQDEHWPRKWGPLVPHDIQFQLCEFDKYERVRLGEGRPRSRYKHVENA